MKPYRETTNVIIINERNEILCVDVKGSFIAFPGGGLEEKEMQDKMGPIKATIRECKEELGYVGLKPKLIDFVYYDFFPEWAKQSEKNKRRYEIYSGEKVYLLIARFDKNVKTTKPTDPLPNKPQWMHIEKVITKIKEYGYVHANQYPVKVAQLMILQMLWQMDTSKIKLVQAS